MNMAEDKAEDPTELLKTLAENRTMLEKQIGCLASLLQLFSRHRTLAGYRCGSNRASSVHEKSSSHASDTLVQEAGSTLKHRRSERKQLGPKTPICTENASVEARSLLDKDDILSEAATPSRLSFYFENQPAKASPRRASPNHSPVHHQIQRVFPSQRRMSLDRKPSYEGFAMSPNSSLIHNVARNSLNREKPRVSVDNSNREVMAGLIRLKNLARSRSVGGRNAYPRTYTEFPRSSSLHAQKSLGVHSDSIEDSPGFLARERIASNLTQLRRSVDICEIPRLTVELEEGPGVGSSNERRQKFIDYVNSELRNPHNHEREAVEQVTLNLKKSLRSLNVKETYRAFQKEKANIRRSLIDGDHRSSPQASVASRLDGRSPQREPSVPRDDFEGRRGGPNVVARLMGLEEFSSPPSREPKEAGSIGMVSKCPSPDTRLGGCDAYRHGQSRERILMPKHCLMDGMPFPMQQQEALEALKSKHTTSVKQLDKECPLPSVQVCKYPTSSHEALHAGIIQLQQLRFWNAMEERDTLNQILGTLQLKGLLHSPQRKSREAASRVTSSSPTPACTDHDNALDNPAPPEYGRLKYQSRKSTSDKHDGTIVIMKPSQTKIDDASPNKVADCKSNRSESFGGSEATTSTRFSVEDGGLPKSGRGRSRSPVRSSIAQPRMNDDAQSESPSLRHPSCGEGCQSQKVCLSVKATSGQSNARSRSPQMTHFQGHASHLRDKKESKAALVTVRGQSPRMLKKDAGSDKKNSRAQTAKVSAEVVRLSRQSRVPGRDLSPPPRRSSPLVGHHIEDKNTTENILEKTKPVEETVAATQAVALKETHWQDWKKECQARVTAGGAMDQSAVSGNHDPCVDRHTLISSPARIRAKLQTLKDQQFQLKGPSDVEDSNEMMTPRGFSVEKTRALEKQQGLEGCEQLSPVSVLNKSIFEEECSPSPTVTVVIEDTYEPKECGLKTRVENSDQTAITSSTSVEIKHVTHVPPPEYCDHHDLPAEIRPPLNTSVMRDHSATPSSSRDNLDRDLADVLLMLSGVEKANWLSDTFSSGLLQDFEGNDHERATGLEPPGNADLFSKCHRQALFDFTLELLTTKMTEHENFLPWINPAWAGTGQQLKKQTLADAIWKELKEFPSAAYNDECEIVKGILQENLGSRGPKWTDFQAEVGEVGVEVEKMIYRDLMEEVMRDLKYSSSCRYLSRLFEAGSGPRRQLFT